MVIIRRSKAGRIEATDAGSYSRVSGGAHRVQIIFSQIQNDSLTNPHAVRSGINLAGKTTPNTSFSYTGFQYGTQGPALAPPLGAPFNHHIFSMTYMIGNRTPRCPIPAETPVRALFTYEFISHRINRKKSAGNDFDDNWGTP
jgi:hypothetical protein